MLTRSTALLALATDKISAKFQVSPLHSQNLDTKKNEKTWPFSELSQRIITWNWHKLENDNTWKTYDFVYPVLLKYVVLRNVALEYDIIGLNSDFLEFLKTYQRYVAVAIVGCSQMLWGLLFPMSFRPKDSYALILSRTTTVRRESGCMHTVTKLVYRQTPLQSGK